MFLSLLIPEQLDCMFNISRSSDKTICPTRSKENKDPGKITGFKNSYFASMWSQDQVAGVPPLSSKTWAALLSMTSGPTGNFQQHHSITTKGMHGQKEKTGVMFLPFMWPSMIPSPAPHIVSRAALADS